MKIAFPAILLALAASTSAAASDVVGATSGIFVNPDPSAGRTFSGVGTSTFLNGAGAPNELRFVGSSFASDFETPFKIGTLNYYNGMTIPDSYANSVDLKASLAFTTPALPTFTSDFTLNFINTPNGSDPDASADFVFFPSSYGGSSFLIGGTTYFVQLTGFGNVTGDGFLASDSSQLHVRENASASADLFAKVTAVAPPAVPEPATWAMTIVGFGAMGGVMRRRSVRLVPGRP